MEEPEDAFRILPLRHSSVSIETNCIGRFLSLVDVDLRGIRWPAINHLPGWRGIRFEPYGRAAHLSAVERGGKNPFAQRFVVTQRTPDTQSEVTGICVDEARADPTVAPMAVNQRQSCFAHLPGLLHKGLEPSTSDDLGGMVSVEVNFHTRVLPPLFGPSIAAAVQMSNIAFATDPDDVMSDSDRLPFDKTMPIRWRCRHISLIEQSVQITAQ